MKRSDFIKALALTPIAIQTMKASALSSLFNQPSTTTPLPAFFIGHGSPMNAIEVNPFTQQMALQAKNIPTPKAILVISAHWETRGTQVTGQINPPTIHDFGGFPQALFDVQYPAPGSPELAKETQQIITSTSVEISHEWGFDHGAWSVIRNMYPNANIPMIQLSLDYTQPAQYHYELAKQLNALRYKNVLIVGSGNIVHNLRMLYIKNGSFNTVYGHDWALEFDEKFKAAVANGNHNPVINYQTLTANSKLAVPTPEHYLPSLYILALQQKNEQIHFFNDSPLAGSLTMTSFKVA